MYAIRSYYVPGAVEIPLAVKKLAKRGQFDAVIALAKGVVPVYANSTATDYPADADAARHVITSYSIHYTKLYDTPPAARGSRGRPRERSIRSR